MLRRQSELLHVAQVPELAQNERTEEVVELAMALFVAPLLLFDRFEGPATLQAVDALVLLLGQQMLSVFGPVSELHA